MKIIAIWYLSLSLLSCYNNQAKPSPHDGKILPVFNLLLIDSTTYFNTNNISTETPTVFLFFNPDCPYSRAQITEITKNMSKLKHIKFYLLTSMPFAKLKDIYEHYKLSKFSNITCGYDYTSFFCEYFKVPGVPYMAIYGKNKKLKKAFAGKINPQFINDITRD
jgi:thiol-disulfide isomerase/thioredoxin